MKMSINEMDNSRVQVCCTECGAPDMVSLLEYFEAPFCYNCGESETLILDDPDFED